MKKENNRTYVTIIIEAILIVALEVLSIVNLVKKSVDYAILFQVLVIGVYNSFDSIVKDKKEEMAFEYLDILARLSLDTNEKLSDIESKEQAKKKRRKKAESTTTDAK